MLLQRHDYSVHLKIAQCKRRCGCDVNLPAARKVYQQDVNNPHTVRRRNPSYLQGDPPRREPSYDVMKLGLVGRTDSYAGTVLPGSFRRKSKAIAFMLLCYKVTKRASVQLVLHGAAVWLDGGNRVAPLQTGRILLLHNVHRTLHGCFTGPSYVLDL